MAEARLHRSKRVPEGGAGATVTSLRERPAEADRDAPGEGAKPAPPAAGEAPSGSAKPKHLRRVLLLLGPVVLVAVGVWMYLTAGRYISTDNAYVKADELTVATDVSL